MQLHLSGVLVALVSSAGFASSGLSSSGDTDWPQFRGPLGTGVVPAAKIPVEWSAKENVAWQVSLNGLGWSQPIVVGTTVYLTSASGEGLERPMAMDAGANDPRTMKEGQPPDVTIEWRVLALDLATGEEKWSASVAKAKPKYPIHPSNTWASETPCADANGVYAFFGATGTLAAFDPAGKPRWKAELGAHPVMSGFGTASSPAIHEGKIFVQCFNEDAAFLVAFDAGSGKELWRVTREKGGTSWSSPLVWRNEKRVELVAAGDMLLTSHDPATGKELWRVSGVNVPGSCSFGADSERLYFGQKSPMGNPPLYALEAGGSGDLSPAQGSTALKNQVWSQNAGSPDFASPVAVDGLVYVTNENLLTCRDAGTGELLYKERLPGLVLVVASPIVIGDKILLLDEEGHALFVQVGPEFTPVGNAHLEDMFWSTPTVAGDSLLLRGTEKLYCIRG